MLYKVIENYVTKRNVMKHMLKRIMYIVTTFLGFITTMWQKKLKILADEFYFTHTFFSDGEKSTFEKLIQDFLKI